MCVYAGIHGCFSTGTSLHMSAYVCLCFYVTANMLCVYKLINTRMYVICMHMCI